jgi:hypothetical protein
MLTCRLEQFSAGCDDAYQNDYTRQGGCNQEEELRVGGRFFISVHKTACFV